MATSRQLTSLLGGFPRFFLFAAALVGAMSAYFVVQFPRGIDTNWDLRNYHLATWVLFSRGDYFEHVAPAGTQYFLSPFLNAISSICYELLGLRIGGVAIATLHALMMAVTVSLLSFLSLGSGRQLSTFDKTAVILAAILLSVAAPMPLGTMGTSFADNTLALLLAILVWVTLRTGFAPNRFRPVWAATLLSLCLALKLTAFTFALAYGVSFYAIAFASCGPDQRFAIFKEIILFAVCSVLATLILAGPWMTYVYYETGNPVFPYANNYFKSPLIDFSDMSDKRFLPSSIWQFFSYPWTAATGRANVSEVPFADARYLIAAVIGASLLFSAVLPGRLWRTAGHADRTLDTPTWFLAIFLVLTLLLWRWTISNQRYLAFADVLIAVLLVRMIASFPRFLVTPSLVVVSAIHLRTAVIPDWEHRLPSQVAAGTTRKPPLLGEALVFLGEKPMGYVVGLFGSRSRFILASTDQSHMDVDTSVAGPFAPRVRALIDRPFTNGIWVLYRGNGLSYSAAYLSGYGLKISPECQGLQTFAENLILCKVDRS